MTLLAQCLAVGIGVAMLEILLAFFRCPECRRRRRTDRLEFEHGDARLTIEAKALNEAVTRAKYPVLTLPEVEPRGM